MPNPTSTEQITEATPHGDLDCAVTEALLSEVTAENARLRDENMLLLRRLDNAIFQKTLAIDEAVEARSRI